MPESCDAIHGSLDQVTYSVGSGFSTVAVEQISRLVQIERAVLAFDFGFLAKSPFLLVSARKQ